MASINERRQQEAVLDNLYARAESGDLKTKFTNMERSALWAATVLLQKDLKHLEYEKFVSDREYKEQQIDKAIAKHFDEVRRDLGLGDHATAEEIVAKALENNPCPHECPPDCESLQDCAAKLDPEDRAPSGDGPTLEEVL